MSDATEIHCVKFVACIESVNLGRDETGRMEGVTGDEENSEENEEERRARRARGFIRQEEASGCSGTGESE